MSLIDMSILIVHTHEFRIARQTLRNLRRAAPRLVCEIIVIDNNPSAGFGNMLVREFPEVRYVPLVRNKGFGAAMNEGLRRARGETVFIFNPDLAPHSGSFETLHAKLLSDDSIGILAPQLQNPDGTLQYSAFLHPTLLIPLLRRTAMGKTCWGIKRLAKFQLRTRLHEPLVDVGWVMGSAMLARREDMLTLGGFDEDFFMYYEDADLCRRMQKMGKRVVYFSGAHMVHYHRRASADGSFLRQLVNKYTWWHTRSAFLYAIKHHHVFQRFPFFSRTNRTSCAAGDIL